MAQAEGGADYTTTLCARCELSSKEDVGMVGCDSCKHWYHFKCVGVTAEVKKEKKWFCPEPPCQERGAEYCKKQESGATKKQTTKKKGKDDSDKSSVTSEPPSVSIPESVLKALEDEQRKLEEEMAVERLVKMKKMEIEKAMQKKRMEMEQEIQRKEMEQEKELLEKALREKQDHLYRMKSMREAFKSKMENVEKQLCSLKAGAGEPERVKSNALNPMEGTSGENRKVPPSNTGFRRNSSLANPSAQKVQKKHEQREDPKHTAGSESEPDFTENETDDEAEDVDTNPLQEGNRTMPPVLGQQQMGPTKCQLAARSSISKRLPTFTGRPEEWPLFYGTYQASNQACGFSDVENLVRLQESLKGPALECVRGQLLLPKSVPRVIEKLRQLYGRPEQLLQSHLERVQRLDPPKSEKLATYIPFGNVVEQLCEHLEAAELEQHLLNPLLIQNLVDKLPANDKREWVRFKKRHEIVTLRTFTDFLSAIVAEACEANVNLDYKTESKSSSSGNSGRGKPKEKGAVYNHSASASSPKPREGENMKPKPCKVCQRTDHRLRFCQDFKHLPLADRQQVVTRWKLCKVCLNDHGNAACKFKIKCDVEECNERHHPLLHPSEEAINTHIRTDSSVLFRMLPVKLHCGDKSVNTLAFLDEGASVSLVEKQLVEQLGAVGVQESLTIKWTGDISRIEKDSKRMNVWISAAGKGEKILLKAVRSVGALMLPKQSLNAADFSERYRFMRGLPISSYQDGRPGVLIGLNNLHCFAPIEAKIGAPGEPIAVRSRLGWSVYGPRNNITPNIDCYVGHHQEVTNQDLHDLLKKQYAVEESVAAVVQESKEEKRAREILEQTTRRVGNRFETGLLWRSDNPCFPDSKPMALRRLQHLEQRLTKNPELYQNVRQQIDEYQQKEYAHRATVEELTSTDPEKVWYLPLNVVLNPKKPEKVRLVWDAAASVQGVSLNSHLLKGPDMLTSLVGVINRFRERRIGFGGDIKEMYHQLRIREADKQAQRFLFRNAPTDPPITFVMDVATFGATSSPCSAQFVKNSNAKEYAALYPEAAAAIVDKHYVDDYFDSVDTIQEAVDRANQVKFIHSKAGFELRNWVSNSPKVLRSMGEQKAVQDIHFNRDKETETERVLGIIWNPLQDVFSFSTQHRQDLKAYLSGSVRPTKRIALSTVMGFFDPLGLLGIFTIHGRILVQNLWRTGCEWDEEIDDDSWTKWKQWTNLLAEVEAVRIPRCYIGDVKMSAVESLELHIFTDASEFAFGCVAYFRVVARGVVRCCLVMSRSKVAPLKKQSIPRLELMAAVLGARMQQVILSNHSYKVQRTFLWTDSKTVLSWLRSDQHKYKQFVAFRVGEILELTKLANWCWIPSKLNIADALTKWGQGPPLESSGQWFNGPNFLYELENAWPSKNLPSVDTDEERKAFVLLHVAVVTEPVINVQCVSSWGRLVRIVAQVGRFISNLRRKKEGFPIHTVKATNKQQLLIITKSKVKTVKQPLQMTEFQRAEATLWKLAQNEGFHDEMRVLKKNLDMKPGVSVEKIARSSVLYKLTPMLDEQGVLRMRGRMEKPGFIPFDMKFPIVLPRNHDVTRKLIQSYHERFGHANRETVFNELRQKFHITNLRTAIRQVMRECMWCRVYRRQPTVPLMAPLPVQRIPPNLRPFSSVGVDYLGPIEVTYGRRTEKRWIAVFTCMAIRAVHLEMVYSLTTQSCLMAIRRFIDYRGAPDEIFSDNGTYFKGACKELTKQKQEINQECAERITSATTAWNFIPPRTPHMGGVWERMVRSVKEAMKALDDGGKLTDEILLTTIAEAEEMINTRPLTYIPQELAEEEALTPNHFLRGTCKGGDLKLGEPTDLAEALRDAYKRSLLLADETDEIRTHDLLWKRWYQEYLPTINKRTKWFDEQKPVKPGDLVFVVDGSNRKSWVRGIIEEVIPGSDGRIRQVNVKTSKGVFRRSVANLAVLEISDGKSGSPKEPVPELRVGECQHHWAHQQTTGLETGLLLE